MGDVIKVRSEAKDFIASAVGCWLLAVGCRFWRLVLAVGGGMSAENEVIRSAMLARQMLSKKPTIEPPPLPLDDEPVASRPKRAASHSKKYDVAKLPKDWRSQIFVATKPRTDAVSKLSAAVAMLWATGCRPVELQAGILVSLVDGALNVHIKGAKHGEIRNGEGTFDRGLEWRTLKINPDLNEATKYLARLVQDGKEHKVEYNKNSIRTRINELGRVIQTKKKGLISVSPYTFRHAMGSDIKSCDSMTDEEKSQIMGHLSCDSLHRYGRRRHGGGAVSPVQSVEASADPHGEYSIGQKKPSKHLKLG